MTGLAWKADGIRQRKAWRRMKQLSFALTGMLAFLYPALACDDSLPPLSTLATQKTLVETLQVYVEGVREEERVGQRSMYEIMDAEEEYAEELETLQAMEACTAAGNGSPQSKVLHARLKAASDHLDALKSWKTAAEDRFQVGEVTRTDIALVSALAVRAEIRLETLKKTAGQ